jgi:hypothetical protein
MNTDNLQLSLNIVADKLDQIIELLRLSTPKNSKELLLETIREISTCSAYRGMGEIENVKQDMIYNENVDPNFTNNDIGLPGGVQYTTEYSDKLCSYNK